MIKIEQRKIYLYLIYPLVTIIFIALSIGFIMSAKGYRFSFDRGIKIEKTGMIIGSTRPAGAKLFLNGKDISKATNPFLSTKLNNLIKGKYALSYKKDGYYTWQKDLLVYPEMVTWANYVFLFSENPRIEKNEIKGTLVNSINFEDNKASLFLVQQGESQIVYLVNNSNDERTSILETGKMKPEERILGISLISWSYDHKKVLIKGSLNNQEVYYLVDTDTKSLQNLASVTPLKFESAYFNPTNSGELFLLFKGQLTKVNLATKATQNFSENNLNFFTITKDGKIFYIKDILGIRSLWQMNGDFTSRQNLAEGVPVSDGYDLKVSSKDQKVALRTKDKALYLITREDNREIFTLMGKNISEFSWSPDGDRLIYKSGDVLKDFEFVDYKKESKEYEISGNDNIKSVVWYDNDHLLAETVDNKVEVMDFDGENKVKLANILPDSKIFFSSDNHNISYFSKSDDSKFTLSRYVTDF